MHDGAQRGGELESEREREEEGGVAAQPMFAFFHHQKQINALRLEVDVLRREFRTLELEWTDMYDRCRRTLMKISKRAQREEGELPQPPGVEPTGSTLVGRAAEIQARILARRKGVNGGILPG